MLGLPPGAGAEWGEQGTVGGKLPVLQEIFPSEPPRSPRACRGTWLESIPLRLQSEEAAGCCWVPATD